MKLFDDEEMMPVTLDDMEGVRVLLRVFLDAMQRRLPPSQEQQAAFDLLECLYRRLGQEGKNALLMEDILLLDAALMLFSIFLMLEVPRSERREIALDGLWEMRGQLSMLRRTLAAGLN